MSDFTIKDIYERVIELGEEDPDFIYTKQEHYGHECFYLGADEKENGRPCIVGQAMIDLGADEDRMRSFDNDYASLYVRQYLGINYLDLSDQESTYLNILNSIQSNQDNGDSWGSAVSGALHTGIH